LQTAAAAAAASVALYLLLLLLVNIGKHCPTEGAAQVACKAGSWVPSWLAVPPTAAAVL
jgi:hypothetical protein